VATQNIVPCLCFTSDAEEAARFYTSLFPNSKIVDISRYGSAGPLPEGTVLAVSFELDGRPFLAINGPEFTFSEAVSFQITCQSQEEIDSYWERLTAGGEESYCGWLKDRFGVSWQVTPSALAELLSDPDPARSQGAMRAMLQMKKLDMDMLERAASGAEVG
jgi:predicted 3-demethylubiquinone-9 3-methyltransferase (glyoxalase superfamily)